MRVAIFSDIHGNAVALAAVLADIATSHVDALVCLGDAIQGGPQPAEVASRLREIGCPVVMGNADAWLLSGEESASELLVEERRQALDTVRAWSLTQLSKADRDFIEGFPPVVEMSLGGAGALLAFHGSPLSYDDVILPDVSADRLSHFFGRSSALIHCGGHTHVPFLRRIGAGPAIFVNPGSVGFAYSHQQPVTDFRANPWAEYALIDVYAHRLEVAFRRTSYDVEALISAYTYCERPGAASAIAQYRGRT